MISSLLGLDNFQIIPAAMEGLNSAQQAAMLQDAQQQLQNMQQPQKYYPLVEPPKPNKHERAIDLLKMRLGGVLKEFKLSNEEFLICHVYKDTVFVFFVARGVGGQLEESVNTFPSDKLIAQLRLLWL